MAKGKGKGKGKGLNPRDPQTIGQLLLTTAMSHPLTLGQITRAANAQVGADRKSALTALGSEASVSRPFQQAGANQGAITSALLDQLKNNQAYTARLAAPAVAGQMGALDASGRATGVAVGAVGGGPQDLTPGLNQAATPILQQSALNANAVGSMQGAVAARAAYDASRVGSAQAGALDKWRSNVQAIKEQSNASRQKLISQMQQQAFQERMGNANLMMGLYNSAVGSSDLMQKLLTTERGQDIAATTAANAEAGLNERELQKNQLAWDKQSRQLRLDWWKAHHPNTAMSMPAGVREAMAGINAYIADAYQGKTRKQKTGRSYVEVSVANTGTGQPSVRKIPVPTRIAGNRAAIRAHLEKTFPTEFNAGVQYNITDPRAGPVMVQTLNSRNRATVAASALAAYRHQLAAYGIDPATIKLWVNTAMNAPIYKWD